MSTTSTPANVSKTEARLLRELKLSVIFEEAWNNPAVLINEIEVTDSRTFEKFRFSGMLDPTDGWAWQRDVLDWWQENDRTLILKARQLGITWVAAAYALWQLLYRPGARVLVYSIGEKEAQTVARRIYTMYLSLPIQLRQHVKKIKPDKSEIPTEEIIFQHQDGTLSSLRSMTSTKASGQGETASLVILDEFAYNENAVAIWKATQPAVSGGGKKQGKTIVISTANGVAGDYDGANFYYHLWDQAADRRIQTKFLPWSAHPDRDETWYADNAMTLPPRERAESYPSSAQEAFQGTGACWFDADAIDFYSKNIAQPLYRAVFELDDQQSKGTLRKRDTGLIGVFQEPEKEKDYAIAVDPASGGGMDSSVVYVLDLHTQALCAEIRSSTVDPDILAQQLHFLGNWFNRARIAVERTGGWGGVIITSLRDGRDGRPPYPRIYRHRDSIRPDVREEARYGFPTTTVTRKQIVSALEVAVRERTLPWLTPDLFKECRTFGEHITKTGRPMTPSPCAAPGTHDDTVIAAGIALYMYGLYGKGPKLARASSRFKKKRLTP